MTIPSLCVVGHPNRGKSSIVATLTENDAVYISPESGATTHADRYEFTVAGEHLISLIDTPGFQRARQVTAWLTSVEVEPADRPARVRAFLDEPEHRIQFHDEVELLTPILAGAGILYVVDGSEPPTRADHAEMEILQWTGQPRMAVINPMGKETHIAVWQSTLGQFFQWVRLFNPLTATADDKQSLFRAMAELSPDWYRPMSKLLQVIELRNQERLERWVEQLVHYFIAQLSRTEPVTLIDEKTVNRAEQKLIQKLDQAEQQLCREALKHFGHNHSDFQRDIEWDINDGHLMNTELWYLWGLKQKELLILTAGAGAATGALVDVGLGGASLMLGALSGGLVGSLGGWWASKQLPGKKVGFISLTREKKQAGPVVHPNFPLVVMARALTFSLRVMGRNHALRDTLLLNTTAKDFTRREQIQLLQWAEAIQKGKWRAEQQDALQAFIYEQLTEEPLAAIDNSQRLKD